MKPSAPIHPILPPPSRAHPLLHWRPLRYVPKNKNYYRPHVDSQCEARGELPPTARMLASAGSRPFMPVFATTAIN